MRGEEEEEAEGGKEERKAIVEGLPPLSPLILKLMGPLGQSHYDKSG